jgi:hypothetical protein
MGADRILTEDRPILLFENGRGWNCRQYGYTEDDFFNAFSRWGYEVFDLHGRPLTRDTWRSENIGFEFIAGHRSDPRLKEGLGLCEQFWRGLADRVILTEWKDCTRAVRDLPAYFRSGD